MTRVTVCRDCGMALFNDRECAPSLDGYGLVDGLLAAADLLDGLPGPSVSADQGPDVTKWPPMLPLAALISTSAQSDE